MKFGEVHDVFGCHSNYWSWGGVEDFFPQAQETTTQDRDYEGPVGRGKEWKICQIQRDRRSRKIQFSIS